MRIIQSISAAALLSASWGAGAANVNLTMAVTPTGYGTTTPAVGTTSILADSDRAIAAVESTSTDNPTKFWKWTAALKSTKFADANAKSTNVKLQSDDTVTAHFVKSTLKLVMAANPAAGGTTTPPLGDNLKQATLTPIAITAVPGGNYEFVNWSTTQDAVIADSTKAETTVTLYTSAPTVTAHFKLYVNLTMLATPNPVWGTITPATGTTTKVVPNVKTSITATAAVGYRFVNWAVTVNPTKATIANEKAAATTVTLSADATVSAVFEEMTAKLTMEILPDSAWGTTTPPVGVNNLKSASGIPLSITYDATKYTFGGWVSTGGAVIANPANASTTLDLTADAKVSALLAPASGKLTMAVKPEGIGTTVPAASEYPNQPTLQDIAITATASDPAKYYFDGWTYTGSCYIAAPSATSTTMKLLGDAVVTANFSDIPPTAKLSMVAYPTNGGTTTPQNGGTTDVDTKAAIPITATPAADFMFSRWDTSGKAQVADPTAPTSTVTIYGDSTVTAKFLARPSGDYGVVFWDIYRHGKLVVDGAQPDDKGNPPAPEPARRNRFGLKFQVEGDYSDFNSETALMMQVGGFNALGCIGYPNDDARKFSISNIQEALDLAADGNLNARVVQEKGRGMITGFYYKDDPSGKTTKLKAGRVRIVWNNQRLAFILSFSETYPEANDSILANVGLPLDLSYILEQWCGNAVALPLPVALRFGDYFFTNPKLYCNTGVTWTPTGVLARATGKAGDAQALAIGDPAVTIVTMLTEPLSGASTLTPEAGEHFDEFSVDDTIDLEAYANDGYVFDKWVASGSCTLDESTIDPDDPKSATGIVTLTGPVATITAYFRPGP